MKYLLDTDICSYLMRNDDAVWTRLQKVAEDSAAMSVVTQGELRHGLARQPKATRLRSRLEALNAGIPTLELTSEAAVLYGELRAHLERKGTPIGPNDLWIAAHALAIDAVLVSNNTNEYSRVPKLRLENWLASR